MAAEAEFEVRRVRACRLSLLALGTSVDPAAPEPVLEERHLAATLLNVPRLDRYEQRALSRRNRALRLL
jgi:hypothetical protein